MGEDIHGYWNIPEKYGKKMRHIEQLYPQQYKLIKSLLHWNKENRCGYNNIHDLLKHPALMEKSKFDGIVRRAKAGYIDALPEDFGQRLIKYKKRQGHKLMR